MSIGVVGSSFVAAAATYDAAVLADSPWGYWPIPTTLAAAWANTGTDTATWYAASPTVINQTALAGSEFAAGGPGTGYSIAYRDALPSELTTDCTFECFIKVGATSQNGYPFLIGSGGAGGGWGAYIESTRNLSLLNPNVAFINTGYNFAAGAAVKLSITRTTGFLTTVYINGSSVYSNTFGSAATIPPVGIGRDLNPGIIIDDVVLFDTAHSAGQIATRYNGGTYSAALIAADNPLVWLKLDDAGQGNQLLDISGNGRHLNWLGWAPTSGPLTGGGGAKFSGTYGSMTSTVSTAQPTTVTYEFWIKYAANPSADTVIATNQGSGASGITSAPILRTDGKLKFALYNGAGVDIVAPSALSTGAWHHVVMSVGAAGAKIRVDKSTVVSSATTSVISAVSGLFAVRAGGPNVTPGFGVMEIANPATWRSQLSDAQTDAHFNAAV